MTVAALEENKAVVSQWIEDVFNAKKLEAINDLKVGSYLDWTPFPGQRLDLPVSGLKESFPVFIKSIPDFEFTSDSMLAEGDFVVCLGHWKGTHQKEFMGMPPTGRRVGGTRIDIFRVVGDKMVEHWGCGNELGFLQMLEAIAPEEEDDLAERDPKWVARQYVEEVLNHRNLAALDRLVNIHAVDHSNQALAMFFVLSAFPDFEAKVEEVMASEDTVTVVSTYSGTHEGDYMGVAATGKTVTGQRIDIFRIVDGEIVESWQDWDTSSLLAQIRA